MVLVTNCCCTYSSLELGLLDPPVSAFWLPKPLTIYRARGASHDVHVGATRGMGPTLAGNTIEDWVRITAMSTRLAKGMDPSNEG